MLRCLKANVRRGCRVAPPDWSLPAHQVPSRSLEVDHPAPMSCRTEQLSGACSILFPCTSTSQPFRWPEESSRPCQPRAWGKSTLVVFLPGSSWKEQRPDRGTDSSWCGRPPTRKNPLSSVSPRPACAENPGLAAVMFTRDHLSPVHAAPKNRLAFTLCLSVFMRGIELADLVRFCNHRIDHLTPRTRGLFFAPSSVAEAY
jgi:hypothetical protein